MASTSAKYKDPKYDSWHNHSLEYELDERGLSATGTKPELVQRLVAYDADLVPRRIPFTQANDPNGDLERAQSNAEYHQSMNALSIRRATAKQLEVKLKEEHTRLKNDNDAAWAKKNSENIQIYRRVEGYKTANAQPLPPPAAASRIQASRSEAAKHPLKASDNSPPPKKQKRQPPDTAPNRLSDDVLNEIAPPYLFIPSSSKIEVRGDRLDEIMEKFRDYEPEDVLGDKRGYYIVFSIGEEGASNMKACFDYWRTRNTHLFGTMVHLEMVEEDMGSNNAHQGYHSNIEHPGPWTVTASSNSPALTSSTVNGGPSPRHRESPVLNSIKPTIRTPALPQPGARLTAKGMRFDAIPDSKPNLVRDSVFEGDDPIGGNYLFISAVQLPIKGDRIKKLEDMFVNYGPEEVQADPKGYYICWGFFEDEQARMQDCYEEFSKNVEENVIEDHLFTVKLVWSKDKTG